MRIAVRCPLSLRGEPACVQVSPLGCQDPFGGREGEGRVREGRGRESEGRRRGREREGKEGDRGDLEHFFRQHGER